MDHLDYHDLRAFWAVVREGSMAAAAGVLHVGRPAVSMRVRALETALGAELFVRRGRTLELTEQGELVFGYADDIFRLGRELGRSLGDDGGRRWRVLRVGVVRSVPKLTAFELLAPICADGAVELECRQGASDSLLTDLAAHRVDVVLTDAPPVEPQHAAARHHPLVESEVGIFAARALAEELRSTFPDSLDGAPLLVPARGQTLRGLLDGYLDRHGFAPRTIGAFDDSALLKVFAQAGRGAFPAPTANAESIAAQFECELVGRLDGVVERFYAVTGERRLQHPAVEQLIASASSSARGPGPTDAADQSAGTTSPS